ncbi:unnamed protein product [Pedinophyceae sp. YPF-701]|nr:unnamed protein product [Pedinophyceae sp. YPF-701]
MGCLNSKEAVGNATQPTTDPSAQAHSAAKTASGAKPKAQKEMSAKAKNLKEMLEEGLLSNNMNKLWTPGFILGSSHAGNLHQNYQIGKELGKGHFGVVRLVVDKRNGETYACKTISKSKIHDVEDVKDIRKEVSVLYHLQDSSLCMNLVDAHEDSREVHLILELCTGGELFDRIVTAKMYSEKKAATIMKQIIQGIAYMHEMGITHRDIKPENFLLKNPAPDFTLRMGDFGLSTFFRPGQTFDETLGSANYMAPEVIGVYQQGSDGRGRVMKPCYTEKADVWSCGVILYILLSGLPPFWGKTHKEIFNMIRKSPIDFQTEPWPKVSSMAKDLVSKMLDRDMTKRLSAREVLAHPWMQEKALIPDEPLESIIGEKLKRFRNFNLLQKKVMRSLATNLQPSEVAGLRNMFEAIDADNSGGITVQELKQAIRDGRLGSDKLDLAGMIEAADADGDGILDWEEFLTATIARSKVEKGDRILEVFQKYDQDGNGLLSKEEIEAAMQAKGDLSPDEVARVLDEVDQDGDGSINYEEFVRMLVSHLGDIGPQARSLPIQDK